MGISIKNIRKAKKLNASKRNIPFSLTADDIKELVDNAVCFYSGEKLNFRNDNNPLRFSIERVDNSKGYTKENSVACSVRYNLLKNDYTLEEFKAMMDGNRALPKGATINEVTNIYNTLIDWSNNMSTNNDSTDKNYISTATGTELTDLEICKLMVAMDNTKKGTLEVSFRKFKSLMTQKKCALSKVDFGDDKNERRTIALIDADKGYTDDNVMAVTHKVNAIINMSTLDELELIMTNLNKRREK